MTNRFFSSLAFFLALCFGDFDSVTCQKCVTVETSVKWLLRPEFDRG